MRYCATITMLLMLSWANAQLNNQWPIRGPGWTTAYKSWGLDFNGGTLDTTRFNNYIDYFFNSSSICSADGQLLFTTNGQSVANTQNTLLVNGDTLKNANDCFNCGNIIGYPQGTLILTTSTENNFVLLHMDTWRIEPNYVDAPWITYDQQPFHVFANAIDMSHNNGQGKIDSTFAIVSDTLIEGQLAATRHANGRDWWVVTHKYLSDLYYITRIGEDLSFETHTQSIGPLPSFYDPFGQACFSPDGSKYCLAVLKGGKKQNVTAQDNSISLFDFDRCTGTFSNLREVVIPNSQVINSCQFSPNSELLYVGCGGKIFQYELATGLTKRIFALDTAPQADYKLMQLAPDGKIYMGSGYTYLSAIERPNELGDSCRLVTRAFDLGYYFYTVPTYPNYYLSALDNSTCDTLGLAIAPPSTGEGLGVRLYPNPATDVVIIETEEPGTFTIYNAVGQLISSAQLNTATSLLPTANWTSGVYYYSFTGSQTKTTNYGKLLKQ